MLFPLCTLGLFVLEQWDALWRRSSIPQERHLCLGELRLPAHSPGDMPSGEQLHRLRSPASSILQANPTGEAKLELPAKPQILLDVINVYPYVKPLSLGIFESIDAEETRTQRRTESPLSCNFHSPGLS